MASGATATPGRSTVVRIPGGIWGEGPEPRRELALRPVGGEDEVFLLDTATALGPAQRANALLGRCLAIEGPGGAGSGEEAEAPEPRSLVGRLTAGDREAALLQLRRLTLGERLDAVIACPSADCGELMELDLAVDDLLVAPAREPRREHRTRVVVDGEPHLVRFRLPTGGDLEATAAAGRDDPDAAALELLRRCVLRVSRGGHEVPVERLNEEAGRAVSAAMARHDPQAVVELDLTCPACGAGFEVQLDAGAYLLQELDARAARLLAEVHALALHYHWSEHDILALPAERRARYLELLAASLGGPSAPDAMGPS